MTEGNLKLLVVDSEEQSCEILQLYFKRRGVNVFIAHSAEEVLSMLKENNPQIMFLDKKMPKVIELLEKIRQFNRELKIIITSVDELDPQTQAEIGNLNVAGYLRKPFLFSELDAIIEGGHK